MDSFTAPEPAPGDSDDEFYEIVDGRRVKVVPPSAYASVVESRIAQRIGNFAETHGFGVAVAWVLFRLHLPVDRYRRPDTAFVSFERWPKDRPMVYRDDAWNVVPDLAVEVVSPTDLADEIVEKMDEYFRSNVRQVWVVHPRQQIVFVYDALTSVRVLTRADELDGGAVLPGLRLPVASLFPAAESA